MTTNSSEIRDMPSFKKVHYALRPRKQIERKIIIELLRDTTRKINVEISNYGYLGMGSIYYYDFILFHKFLNIASMTSLDSDTCVNRFEFNKPFDFIDFKNKSTSNYLQEYQLATNKNTVTWFDYDSSLLWYSSKAEKFRHSVDILDDIAMIADRSKRYDFFLIIVDVTLPADIFITLPRRKELIDNYRTVLSRKYQNTRNITEANFPYIIQNVILNSIKNVEIGKNCKFRKLFSFYYKDSAPMYTLGGIFDENQFTHRTLKNKFFVFDEDKITDINTPLLTYKEKLHLDQRIKFIYDSIQGKQKEEIEKLITTNLGFELNCVDIKSYLEYYKYYPQYYEGII